MPRQTGTLVVNNFIGGLVTERTALSFPENACTETFNCVFDETGRISRRLGFDLEEGYDKDNVGEQGGEVFTEYLWQAVAGDGSRSFVVQQQGGTLYFYDVSDSTSVSTNNTGLTISLYDFDPTGSALDPAQFICQYASGQGRLLVVNRATDPFYVEYDSAANTVTGTAIEIQIRDFLGLEDGLDDNERITSTVADLITNNPEHYYNILNQSWFIGDALTQWDAARTDIPSNRDYVALYRNDQDDAFDNTQVTANTPGTRLAAKGHFILSAWCPDHTQALTDEGFSATISAGETEMDLSAYSTAEGAGDIIGDLSAVVLFASFRGDTAQAANTCDFKEAAEGYLGVNLSNRGGARRITKAIVHGSNTTGFDNGGNNNVTLTLYGKQGSEPTTSTDGTLLGTTTFTDTNDESAGRTITSSDSDTFWDHVWIRFQIDNTGIRSAEIRLFTSQDQEAIFCTTERPQCVEFFAGRAWYAGINYGKLNSKLYFSQIIQKADQLGKCYQANDPASEDFTDLLPDDGGVIVIPEIAEVKRIFAYQSTLLIFATNGVWAITGGSQGGFLATDFVVRRLSNEGMNSPLSVLAFRGVPAWWGHDGIYTVKFDANYQSFSVVSLSDEKIKTFFQSIPEYNRRFVKGVFDQHNAVGYWLYNDSDDLTEFSIHSPEYIYNAVLGINGLSGAFFPWTIGYSATGPQVRGAVYIMNASGVSEPVVKFPVTIQGSGVEDISYAEVRQESYHDWSFFAFEESLPDTEIDYADDNYFITGYRLEGQAIRYFQPGYIIIYHEDINGCASAFVQGVFDFTTSGDSGKWSTRQQCFNPCLRHRNVNYARLKIRGKGRSMQLRFSAESGKPFTIIGWSMWITGHAGV